MRKFEGEKLGLRAKETDKLISIYPEILKGTDDEISKTVRDWFYKQACANEDILLTAYVDVLTQEEIQSRNL